MTKNISIKNLMNIKKKIYPGYVERFKYPTVLIEIDDIQPNPIQVKKLINLINSILPPNTHEEITSNLSLSEITKSVADHVLASFNCGIVEKSHIKKISNGRVQIFIPCYLIISHKLLLFLEICISLLISSRPSNTLSRNIDATKLQLMSCIKSPFKTSNSARFAKAAYKLNCSIDVYENDFIEYGVGEHQIRMRSSLTKSTNSIACAIAKDKKLTSDLICKALLPGSRAIEISSFEHAIKIANKIGFPVVLKPRLLDGGVGVYPNLQNAIQIKTAYVKLQKITNQIIIEKYVLGKDYRLVSYKGNLIWAIERVYPGILGDGAHTIYQLIDIENSNPHRNRMHSSVLTVLSLDDEALECIKKQGYSPESIPDIGTFIRLKDKSNINAGGFPEICPVNLIHSDNKQLINDVTRLIGLDLAGVDLIIPDIRNSWKNSNALICEINAQPTLGELTSSHLYEEILRAEMPLGWTIPIVFLPMLCSLKTLDMIKGILNVKSENLGIVKQGFAYLDDKPLNKNPISCFDATKGLLQHNKLKALILTADSSLVDTGLPHFDIEFLYIPDEYLYMSEEKKIQIQTIIFMITSYCKKILISSNLKIKGANLISQIQEIAPNTQIKTND